VSVGRSMPTGWTNMVHGALDGTDVVIIHHSEPFRMHFVVDFRALSVAMNHTTCLTCAWDCIRSGTS
jgi:hypothetical protein